MRTVAGVALLGITILAQTPPNHQSVLARLGREADLFEQNADRISGTEILTQTIPRGARTRTGPRGIEVALPEVSREIVCDYGFVSMDEPGAPLREVRVVRKVDGQVWRKKTTSLDQLAREISGRDAQARRRQLERFEEHGLVGFITDLGQLILLFARGGVSRYEIRHERQDDAGYAVYTYVQLDGSEAFTVYGESKEPVRQPMKGRIWIETGTGLPMRISMESERPVGKAMIRDVSTVEYARSSVGFLLPARVVHQQFVGTSLHLTDHFEYTGWREVGPPRRR
ncbi:MAG TPA: hypothetical protein VES20_10655 [Bryobacteraceae bacterium]|nr:hypothetical protein [Bryobacteraceae bacterium]